MIAPTFAESVPPRAEVKLRCDRLDCDAVFLPRDAYWDRDSLRAAAAREAAWTQDEVSRDHCGDHRSAYAAQRMQTEAEATYPEATPAAAVTVPDGIPVAEIVQLPTTNVGSDDQEAADAFNATFEEATAEEERRRAYREAGALNLQPHRGKHRGKPKREEQEPEPEEEPVPEKTSKPEREPLLVRLGLVSREPLDLPDDNAPDTDDPAEWMKPFPRDDTRASWEMRSSWTRRGWLRKRRPKTTNKNDDATGVAA